MSINKETIGQRIRRLRESSKLSAQQLADSVNVSKSMIYHLEQDRHAPSLFTFMDIARALKVSLDYLAFGRVKHESIRDNYR
jgi:transcriptional regulator with XRE-family HTH domain